jgi:hypothetical protein
MERFQHFHNYVQPHVLMKYQGVIRQFGDLTDYIQYSANCYLTVIRWVD